MTMTLPNFVRVERAAACAYQRSNRCAFLAGRETANRRAAYRRSGDRQLIPMLLPKSSTMTTFHVGRPRPYNRLRRSHWLCCEH